MPEKYRILQVQPEWALEPEDMGTKEKFWYREPDDALDWLFKRPRPGTGEHWAEKIAAEVAKAVNLRPRTHGGEYLRFESGDDWDQLRSAVLGFVDAVVANRTEAAASGT